MAGRKPVCAANLVGGCGKKRKEKASKSALEVGGDGKPITPPPEVLADPVALSKWKWAETSYQQIGYKPALADLEILSRLCLAYSGLAMIQRQIDGSNDPKTFAELNRLADSRARVIVAMEEKVLLTPTSRMRGLPRETKKVVPENIKDIAGRL